MVNICHKKGGLRRGPVRCSEFGTGGHGVGLGEVTRGFGVRSRILVGWDAGLSGDVGLGFCVVRGCGIGLETRRLGVWAVLDVWLVLALLRLLIRLPASNKRVEHLRVPVQNDA